MQVPHKPSAVPVSVDTPNLVSIAGLLLAMALARDAGLHEVADKLLKVPTGKGQTPD